MVFLNLAFRNVLRNRERSLLTLIGVLLAIGSFVALVSLAEGLYRRVNLELNGRQVDLYILPSKAMVLPTGPIGTVGLSSDTIATSWLDEIRSLPNVNRAEGIVRDAWTGSRTVIPVLALDPECVQGFFPSLVVQSGEMMSEEGQILLGVGAARAEFPKGTASQIVHGQTTYQVVGIVHGGGFQDYFAYQPLTEAMSANGFQEVWIQLRDQSGARGTVAEIERLQIPNCTVLTRKQYLGRLNEYIGYAWLLQFAIASIGVLIAITASMNTMLMSTYERLREFSTLRAIGATRVTVVLMILAESVILSLAGGVLGLLFGWLASGVLDRSVMVLLQVPFPLATVTPRLLAEAMLLSGFVGVIGSIIPSIIVWRLKLVDGLRWD